MARGIEDFARLTFAIVIFLWFLAVGGLVVSAVSQFLALRLLGLAVVGLGAFLFYRGRQRAGLVGHMPDPDDDIMTGNAGQPRVPMNVGAAHKAVV